MTRRRGTVYVRGRAVWFTASAAGRAVKVEAIPPPWKLTKTGLGRLLARATGSRVGGNSPQQLKLAVMLVNFSDDVRQPWTTDYISALYNTGDPVSGLSVKTFYEQSSWGQVTVSADVFGWWVVDLATTGGCNVLGLASKADAIAATNGIDLGLYTHRVYIFPQTAVCSFSGFCDGPVSRHIWINLNPVSCPGPSQKCTDWHSLPHELGHGIGLDHSGKLICQDGAGNNVVLSNTGTFSELMDQFCGMGCCTPSLFSNVRRLQLGWTPLSKMVTITQTGTYTIQPATQQASLVYRLADGTGQYLYFENRAAAEPPVWPTNWDTGNLLIRRVPVFTPGMYTAQPMTALLDGSPADNDLYPNVKGLPVGDGFTLPNLPVTVLNQAYDGTNNTLAVTFA